MSDLLREIEIIDVKIKWLEHAKKDMQEIIYKEESIEFIEQNGINKSNTQFSSEEGLEMFWHVSNYATFLKDSSKKWCEWNERIFLTTDIVNGRHIPTKARLKELT